MHSYQILRVEKTKDRQGADEVFVDLQIYHNTLGVINWPRWFTGAQAQLIMTDESTVVPLVEAMIPGIIAQKQIEADAQNQVPND